MAQDTMDPKAVVDANAVYSLGTSAGESERLKRQTDELASESEALVDRVHLRPGDSAIDLGCGPRGIIELLHDRVSPGGRVVGLDSEPAHEFNGNGELPHQRVAHEVRVVAVGGQLRQPPDSAGDALVHGCVALGAHSCPSKPTHSYHSTRIYAQGVRPQRAVSRHLLRHGASVRFGMEGRRTK